MVIFRSNRTDLPVTKEIKYIKLCNTNYNVNNFLRDEKRKNYFYPSEIFTLAKSRKING